MKKRGLSIFIFLLVGFVYLVYRFFFSMDTLPKGDFLRSVESPTGAYTVKAYVVRGNATVADSVRVEVIFKDSRSTSKNIYWQYREDTADMVWLDNQTVQINGVKLDVTKERYDFRRNK